MAKSALGTGVPFSARSPVSVVVVGADKKGLKSPKIRSRLLSMFRHTMHFVDSPSANPHDLEEDDRGRPGVLWAFRAQKVQTILEACPQTEGCGPKHTHPLPLFQTVVGSSMWCSCALRW